jgi:hypothetical protein
MNYAWLVRVDDGNGKLLSCTEYATQRGAERAARYAQAAGHTARVVGPPHPRRRRPPGGQGGQGGGRG